jgi:hypothetical protein
MLSRRQLRVLLIYQVTAYAIALLFFCGIIPSWGKWYSASPYAREQVRAFLRGDLALSHNPADLHMDLCWSEKGVQQVWGLGVPFWQLPFDVLSRVYGFSKFPDRIALGIFIALVAFIVCRTWFSALARRETEKECHPPITAASGAVILFLFFAPLTYLLRSPLDHYGEPLVYVYYFGVLLACGVIALARNPKWGRFWLLCALAGLGGLIRPTLVFYGFATIAITGLIMFCHERRESSEHGLKISHFFKFIRNSRLLLGLLLFVCGGGLLFITNYLRFGNGWEFGHRLNVSPALPSIYSTRFDYPFKHEPLAAAARELFGALFMANRFNGAGWYDQGIFTWQSPTIRKRGFDMTTCDLSYAVLLAAAWAVCLWLAGKWLRSMIKNRASNQQAGNLQLPGYLLLIMWSIVVTTLLAIFYLRVPVMSDRYMLDFSPAFASSLAGLWWWSTETISKRAKHPKQIMVALFIALIGWQGLEIARGKNAFGPPRSITEEELFQQSEQYSTPTPPPLPSEYKIGDSMKSWGIPYNGEGWSSTNGLVRCCAIFYVESPEFLDLELTTVPDSHVPEASLTTIQAKVGLEFLKRTSITRTNDAWIVHFDGPRQMRYRQGLQPVFLAMVPSEELAKYVTSNPWILKRLSWRKE